MTGWQLALGGAVMVMGGGLASGMLQINSIGAGAVLGYLTLISSVPFAFWSVLLKYNRVSIIAPFNVVMPVAGTVLFAVFQGEDMLGIKYLLALLLVCSGIVLVNKIKKAG